MQPTLRLLLSPRPPPRPLPFIPLRARHRHALLRAVPVADAAVALVEEHVARDAVLGDVVVDLGEGPGEEGVELEEAGGVALEGLEGGAGGALGGSSAGDDGLDVEVGVGAAGGFDLESILQ